MNQYSFVDVLLALYLLRGLITAHINNYKGVFYEIIVILHFRKLRIYKVY